MNFVSLVFANLGRNKVRTALTTLSVFVALFLFCSLRGLTDTLDDTISVGNESRLITRNKVSLVFPLPMAQLERLRAIPGVKAVTWSNWFGGTDPVDPRNFYAQFAIDAPTYLPMYATDIEIVDGSPAPGLPVGPGIDPRLAAFMNERSAAIVGDGLMKKMGWKIRLGDADSKVKRMIFGENSARLYNYQVTADVMDKMSHDKLAQMKDEYNREGVERNNTYYGYIGKKSETA